MHLAFGTIRPQTPVAEIACLDLSAKEVALLVFSFFPSPVCGCLSEMVAALNCTQVGVK